MYILTIIKFLVPFFNLEKQEVRTHDRFHCSCQKVLLITFAIFCCAIIRNIFINLLRGHEHVYGQYWPILGVEIRKILEK